MTDSDVVIVGGGVIGLSIAYVLAREGVAADGPRPPRARPRGLVGRRRPDPAERRAARAPTRRSSSGRGAPCSIPNGRPRSARRRGSTTAIAGPAASTSPGPSDEDRDLRAAAGRWRTEGIAYERLAPGDFARVEPALSPDLRVAYFLPDRAQIRNPRHLRALAAGRRRARARSCGRARRSSGFEVERRARRRRSGRPTGAIPCGTVVVAAGAWSGGLLDGLGVHAPTPPLKGQIVLLRSDRPLLRRIVEHGKNYLVPRDDGRILVGATEEDAGFDTRPTARGRPRPARRGPPALSRPGRGRGRASLGRPPAREHRHAALPRRLPRLSTTFVATGHKRAGLQLAPATAEVIADLVLGRPPRIDLAPVPGRPRAGVGRRRTSFRS